MAKCIAEGCEEVANVFTGDFKFCIKHYLEYERGRRKNT
jgi:hypothetical protein